MLFVGALDATTRRTLARLRDTAAPDLAFRSEIILLSADGWDVAGIARILFCSMRTVYRWLHKFIQVGLRGICLKRVGRPPRSTQNSDPEDEKSRTIPAPGTPVVVFSVAEMQRLVAFALQKPRDIAQEIAVSYYRRASQARAMISHYKKRKATVPADKMYML